MTMSPATQKNTGWIGALCGAALSLLSGASQAQQVPRAEHGNPVVTATRIDNKLQILDSANQNVIFSPALDMFSDMGPGLEVSVEMRTQPSGVDLTYTMVNNGSQPAAIGRFRFGNINLGSQITYQDFRHVGEPVAIDYNNYAFQAFGYPGDLYSPVWVLRNQQYAVGISLQYPILDYKHDVKLMLGSTPADADPAIYGPRAWFLDFRFGNLGDEGPLARVAYTGSLQPGETRTYVVSIRITKTPNDWIRTLIPYRNYFRGMYGGVHYRRDSRPIRPVLMAIEHNINARNPYGWSGYPNQRPDQYTFRPWIDNIKEDSKWSRVMVWAPTGLYDQRLELNLPFQFTSRWVDDPQLASALDPTNGFPSIASSGMTLGLWWGRSVQVARTWNPEVMEQFDPNNRDHREAMFREMDIAVQAGATDIGLDTFNHSECPLWVLYPWLQAMRERYPNNKFCIEPIASDILHTQGAMFVLAWTPLLPQNATSNWSWVQTPYYLADFLNPGHESWAAMSYHVHRSRGLAITSPMVQSECERIADLGYVPIMYEDVIHPQDIRASESWSTTVPRDLLQGSGWNVNYNQNLVVRGADGRMQIISSGDAPHRDGNDDDDAPGLTPPDGSQPTAPSTQNSVPPGFAESNAANEPQRSTTVNRGGKSAKTVIKGSRPSPVSRPSSSRGRKSGAGSATSAAALARLGLLGKSSSVISRRQIQQAMERMKAPAQSMGGP